MPAERGPRAGTLFVVTTAAGLLAACSGRPPASPRAALLDAVRAAAPVSDSAAACARLWGEPAPTLCSTTTRPAASSSGAGARLARDVDLRLARRRSADALADKALVKLATGRLDDALDLIEEAAALAPTQPQWASDLGALLWLRARTRGAGAGLDLMRALAQLDAALERDPRLGEARWNLALVLEALHLDRSAAVEWERYLELGEASGSAQARERREALGRRGRDAQPERLRATLRASDRATVAELARRDPQVARELVEDELLADWGRATVANDRRAAERALRDSRLLAHVLGEVSAESLPAEAVAAIEAASADQRTDLAAGHWAYRHGLEAAERLDWERAGAAYREAEARLRRGGSPFAAAAAVEHAVCLRNLDAAAAERPLDALKTLTHTPGRATLEARRLWTLGLVYKTTGRPLPAYHALTQARSLYERAGERAHAGYLAGLVADVQHELGIDDLVWDGKRRAFAQLDAQRDATRLHSILVGAAGLAREAPALRRAALHLFDELERRLPPQGVDDVRAEASLRRARLEADLGRWDAARARIEALRTLLPRIADGLAERVAADLAVSEALVWDARDPARAVVSVDAALQAYARLRYSDERGTLLALRARGLRRLGRAGQAERDLEQAFAEVATRLAGVRDEAPARAPLRVLRDLTDELVDAQDSAGRPSGVALASLERWREIAWRHIAGRVAGARTTAFAASGLAHAVPTDTAVLTYAVLRERVVGWVVADGRATTFGVDEEPDALRARVARLRAELQRGSDAWRDTAAALYALLLSPAESRLRASQRLLIVPDGFLRGLPFAALIHPRTGRALIEDFVLAQAPSGSVGLQGWPAAQPASPGAPVALVVVGSGTSSDDTGASLPPLAGAEAEARALAQTYARSVVLEGPQATRAAVLRALPRADVVHVAAHGLEGPRDEGTLIVLQVGGAAGPELLRAADLRAQRLPRAPVVVLAACNSAAGERGEGTLVATLLGAGARAVVAALWDVRDADTAAFLTRVHRELLTTGDAPEALRRAQLATLHEPGRPDAAFVAVVGPGPAH